MPRAENYTAIAEAFKKLGWSWWDTSYVTDGGPDAVASIFGANVLLKIIDESDFVKPTKQERDFFHDWSGPIYVISSVEQGESFDRAARGKLCN